MDFDKINSFFSKSLGLDTSSYVFIPVHPWQWNNKILQVFAADIANQNLTSLLKTYGYEKCLKSKDITSPNAILSDVQL